MHKYRFVPTNLWNDAIFIKMSAEHKLIFLYLITSPYTSACGIFKLHFTNMGHFIGYTDGPIESAWAAFLMLYKDWVKYDEETQEVGILYWPKFALVNANNKALAWAQKDLGEVQSMMLLKEVVKRNSSTLSKPYLTRLRQLQTEAINEAKKMKILEELETHGDVPQLPENQACNSLILNTNTNTNTNTKVVIQVAEKNKKKKNAKTADKSDENSSSYRQEVFDQEKEKKGCGEKKEKEDILPPGVLGPVEPLPYEVSEIKRDLEAYFESEENKDNALTLAGRTDLEHEQIDESIESLWRWCAKNPKKRIYSWDELREWFIVQFLRNYEFKFKPTSFDAEVLPDDLEDRFFLINYFKGMADFILHQPKLRKMDGIHGKQWLKLIPMADNKKKREWLYDAVKAISEMKKYHYVYDSLLAAVKEAYEDVLSKNNIYRDKK